MTIFDPKCYLILTPAMMRNIMYGGGAEFRTWLQETEVSIRFPRRAGSSLSEVVLFEDEDDAFFFKMRWA